MNEFEKASIRERKYLQYEIDNYLSKKYPTKEFKIEPTGFTTEYDAIISVIDKETNQTVSRWIVEVKIRNFSPNRERGTWSLKIKLDKWKRLLLNKKFLDVEHNCDHKIIYYNTTSIGSFMIDLMAYDKNWGWKWKEAMEDRYNVIKSDKISVWSDYINLDSAQYTSELKTGDLG